MIGSEPKFPMMVAYEVRALERLLSTYSRVTFLEWGSGNSTIYFTTFLKERGIPYTWVSVEHNPTWFERVQQTLKGDPNVHVIHAPESNLPAYVKAPHAVMEQMGITRFDIALVDGIRDHRNECLEEAKDIAQVVLLHDAQRKLYKKKGRYLAGRLFEIRDRDDTLSRAHILAYQLHEQLWKLKESLLSKSKTV